MLQGVWPATMASTLFSHLHIKFEYLPHHTVSAGGGGVNSPFRFKDYDASFGRILEIAQQHSIPLSG